MTREEKMLEFKVTFTFTTFDLRRSMTTGRNGSICINSTVPKEEIDMAELKQLCVDEMYRLKPKWNIIGLDIKDISPVKQKSKRYADKDRHRL